jgi:transposase
LRVILCAGVDVGVGVEMRGRRSDQGSMFSYVALEDRVPSRHPLRLIRLVVDEVLASIDGDFAALYAATGRPSVPPERVLKALLLQAFYTKSVRK